MRARCPWSQGRGTSRSPGRRLLAIIPAAGLLAVLPPVRASANPVSDHATLLASTVAMFAGTAESHARPEAAAKLAAIGQNARTRLTAMDTAGVGELFKGVPLWTSDSNLSASFYQIALATRTLAAPPPTSRRYQCLFRRRNLGARTARRG